MYQWLLGRYLLLWIFFNTSYYSQFILQTAHWTSIKYAYKHRTQLCVALELSIIIIAVSFGTQSCCSGRRNSGNLMLYSIACTGQTGIFIQDCSYRFVSGYSSGRCNLQNEMTVGCYETASCNAGSIRLVDGNSTLEGRVEVCTQGLWGAITTSSWDSNDAKVVCRQLGLPWECEFI